MTRFGLSETELQSIAASAAKIGSIDTLLLFGSRALGTYRPGSDVDLAIKCSAAGYDAAIQLTGELNEESILPYCFDVVCYELLDNEALKEHIDRVGIMLWTRK